MNQTERTASRQLENRQDERRGAHQSPYPSPSSDAAWSAFRSALIEERFAMILFMFAVLGCVLAVSSSALAQATTNSYTVTVQSQSSSGSQVSGYAQVPIGGGTNGTGDPAGFCWFSAIDGAFRGPNDYIKIYPASGLWTLYVGVGSYGASTDGISATMTCMAFSQFTGDVVSGTPLDTSTFGSQQESNYYVETTDGYGAKVGATLSTSWAAPLTGLSGRLQTSTDFGGILDWDASYTTVDPTVLMGAQSNWPSATGFLASGCNTSETGCTLFADTWVTDGQYMGTDLTLNADYTYWDVGPGDTTTLDSVDSTVCFIMGLQGTWDASASVVIQQSGSSWEAVSTSSDSQNNYAYAVCLYLDQAGSGG